MSRFVISASIAVFALLFTAGSCWAVSLDQVVAALQAPFQADTADGRRIHDYRADFSQQSLITSLGRDQQANGKVVVKFADPSQESEPKVKFRWTYLQPTAQEIVSNGERVWVYMPENNQVIVSDAESAAGAGENNPMAFLTGLGELSRDFLIARAEPPRNEDGHHVLELQPRQGTALLSRLVIAVDQQAVAAHLGTSDDSAGQALFPIRAITLYDVNGNSSRIAFQDVQINLDPPEGTFNFTIPAGVDVVEPDPAGLRY